MNAPYDALLIVSFGGPEGMQDVIPFLENVLRGKNVSPERMRTVASHYESFGGVSPINAHNRKLIAALETELAANGPQLPVYWGNRNWHPMLAETMRKMAEDGIRKALAFVTSAYSSYSGCRQYLEDIEKARAEAGIDAPRIEKLRAFYNHPGFIDPNAETVTAAIEKIPIERRDQAQIVFTAHSIPLSQAMNCAYEAQLEEACRLVAERVAHERWRLVYQSRSGRPSEPWLEPDILDYLKTLIEAGATDVVISPIGFISDHMEVIFDLDIEARTLCEDAGLNMVRASTVGTHPVFVQMIRELVLERTNPKQTKRYLGTRGPSHDQCASDCCLSAVLVPVTS